MKVFTKSKFIYTNADANTISKTLFYVENAKQLTIYLSELIWTGSSSYLIVTTTCTTAT